MASGDPFTTAAFGYTGTFVIDGDDSATGAAIVSGLAGNADAEVRLQAYDGGASAWKTVAVLTDDAGNTTFSADWHTQFNRIVVNVGATPTDGDQRLEVKNVSDSAGDFSADGVER